MVAIKDIMKPRKEVIESRFQGVVQSHKIDANEPRIENNPADFFRITYPSLALKRTLERINEKLSGTSNQGGILLVGPYGSGKTHGIISLYHTFKHPEMAKEWLRKWNINIEIPTNTKSAIVSTRRYDADLLWEPIFTLLGQQGILPSIKRFPTIDQIEKVVGDSECVIFIDEIENWYGSFNPETQADLIERNETFLEHLLEVANDPQKKLLLFITFLEEKEGLKKIFNRTNPVRIDVSAMEDRENIVLHRLFENANQKDLDAVEKVAKEYIDRYTDPIRVDNPYQYRQRMVQTYPFHPLLLDTTTQVYEAATERQDIRGMMNVLADAVKDTHDKKDLILLSDLDENAFRGIDLNLVEKYSYDLDRVKNIPFSREILKSILIYTLNEKTVGATESDILLSVFSPTQGHTLNGIVMDLENIYGKPHYLHKEDGIYLFKHDLNIFALLEKERKKVSEDDVKRKVAEIVKKDVFENRVFIYEFEEIPDDSKTKIVVTLESWGDEETLRSKLNEFYKGKTWQNTYIIVFPTVESILSFEIAEKTRRLIGAQKLQTQVEDKERKLQKLITDELKESSEKIKGLYGYMLRWVARGEELAPRKINVIADADAIRERAGSDASLVGDYILEEIKDKADGQRIEFLINDFRKYRKYPMVLDSEAVYKTITTLQRDKRLITQGERGRWYIEETPKSLEPGYSVFDPQYAPVEVERGAEEEEGEHVEGQKLEEEIAGVERRERKILDLKGNSPRVILSQVEARTRGSDIFKAVNIRYQLKRDLTKEEMMKFIKQLPQEDADIEGEVELWRERDET